jgi:molybdenum cofactor cytidylyltransferase
MGSSVRCGVRAALSAGRGAEAILLLVCDQPRLDVDHLRALLAGHAAGGMAITASQYGERCGVPAVFSAELAGELLQCGGDRGAREVIRRNAARVRAMAWPDGVVDVDRPEDLKGLEDP